MGVLYLGMICKINVSLQKIIVNNISGSQRKRDSLDKPIEKKETILIFRRVDCFLDGMFK